ncbi:MAG: succinate dehydrogenase, hydrophobic membrane anchor protein [Thiobacillus sp.]
MKSTSGAHSGTGTWLLQRATSVVMALAVPLLVWQIVAALPLDYATWRALFAPLWMRLVVLIFTVALSLHAWVGMRDILMDYVHHTGVRLALTLAVIVTLAACVTTMAAALWGVQ